MIVTVPALPPLTIPLLLPIVATDGSELFHVPPLVASFNVIAPPAHTLPAPEIPDTVVTVTTVVAVQPEVPDWAYVIRAVPPTLPVTVPSVPTVATDVLLLVQVPAPDASVSAVGIPAQIGPLLPVIADGCAATFTTVVTVQPDVIL